MFVDKEEEPDAKEVLAALGELAVAASQAEHHAAQGLYFLLADAPGDEEGGARLMRDFRSFDALCRLLKVALRCDTPLHDVLAAAKKLAGEVDDEGDPTSVGTFASFATLVTRSNYLARYAERHRRKTAVDYLFKVKALYDKRNECVHSLGLTVEDRGVHLFKAGADGARSRVDPKHLMEPCEILEYCEGLSLAQAIDAVAVELVYSSIALPLLPATIQWFRRQGTPFDLAPLVDHYMKLALAPLRKRQDILAEKLRGPDVPREDE